MRNFRANDWLTSATRGEPGPSRSEISRPAKSGVPKVAIQPGAGGLGQAATGQDQRQVALEADFVGFAVHCARSSATRASPCRGPLCAEPLLLQHLPQGGQSPWPCSWACRHFFDRFDRMLLHCGPPIAYEDACDPLQRSMRANSASMRGR